MSVFENRVTLVGNVGSNPMQSGTTKSGVAVVNFSIAQTTLGLDPQTGEAARRDPTWFQISCFGVTGEKALNNLVKGHLVLVTGRIRQESYTTAKGERRIAVVIRADEVFKVERLKKLKVTDTANTPSTEPSFEDWDGQEFEGAGS